MLFETQRGVFAAVGLCGGVGLAVRSQGALGAADDTFDQAGGQSQAAGVRMLDAAVLFGGTPRPFQAPVSSCCSEDRAGVADVAWHRVGFDGRGLHVSHVGVCYVRALFQGQQGASSGKVTHLVGTFQLPCRDTEFLTDKRGARRVDPPEHVGDVVPTLVRRGQGGLVVHVDVWLLLMDEPQRRNLCGQVRCVGVDLFCAQRQMSEKKK